MTDRHANILALDPGMAHLGWAVFRILHDGDPHLVDGGTLGSKRSDAKLNIGTTSDNFRRARLGAAHLLSLVNQYDVRAIVAESMSFPRSSSAAAKMAMCWGSIALLSELRSLPVLQVSPQRIKEVCAVERPPKVPRVPPGDTVAKALAEKNKRLVKAKSKDDVQTAMKRRFPTLESILLGMPKGEREHAADACGAMVAALSLDEIRTIRSMLMR
ncbi:MAG: hypothetical protein M3Q55_11245 [Acidobacteriota bacterium]|nr:hypothetical protein [Acidobacteriota bacterium]